MILANKKAHLYFKLFLDFLITVICFLTVGFSSDSYITFDIYGLLLVFVSFYLLFKVRKNSILLIVIGIITYINLSIVFGDILTIAQVLPDSTLLWQSSLRNSIYNLITAKSLLVSVAVLNLMLNSNYLSRIPNEKLIFKKKNNKYIFYIGYFFMMVFWVFGYGSPTQGSYESNTRTVYEYSLLLFIIVWHYSGKSKKNRLMLDFYGLIFIMQSILRGDRSSAFPMILLLILIHEFHFKFGHIIIFAFSGSLLSNLVSIYRISFSFTNIRELFSLSNSLSAFLSDTVSQSYYTALSIIASRPYFDKPYGYFGDFLGGLLFGGSFKNADVGALTIDYNFNRGGGLFFSWFYFWFGLAGVIFASILLGIVIRKAFKTNRNSENLYKVSLTIMTFRWYLYTPFVLFRSVLVIFTMLIFLSDFVDKIVTHKKTISLEKSLGSD